jgi:hypothetical protein
MTALVLVTGCYSGEGHLLDPGGASSQPGDVKKTGLTLTVVADSALAAALGWEENVVAGAEVIVQRGSDPKDRDTVLTDETGVVRLEDLVRGRYKTWGWRQLDEDERALAHAAGFDVWALGNGFGTRVPTTAPLPLFPDEPGSLVISEMEPAPKWFVGDGYYRDTGYIELYNNSDTTIYLDGKVIGQVRIKAMDTESIPCAEEAWHSIDPEGLWIIMLEAFPGSGRDYPLPPGELVLVAVDAIDHSPFHPGAIDLSHADFEFAGPAVDNPEVPNMVDVGLRPSPLGHGLSGLALGTPVVAEPLDVASLPRGWTESGLEMARIPAEKILDVATLQPDYDLAATMGNTECELLIHPNFDRLEGRLYYGGQDESVWNLAIHRRVAGVRTDGRLLLQRTRTTAVDFFVAARSPGVIP